MKNTVKVLGLLAIAMSLNSYANNIVIKDSCRSISDFMTCEAHAHCYWDNGTDRCEHRDRRPCSSYFNAYDCENARGCYWDTLDNRCERE